MVFILSFYRSFSFYRLFRRSTFQRAAAGGMPHAVLFNYHSYTRPHSHRRSEWVNSLFLFLFRVENGGPTPSMLFHSLRRVFALAGSPPSVRSSSGVSTLTLKGPRGRFMLTSKVTSQFVRSTKFTKELLHCLPTIQIETIISDISTNFFFIDVIALGEERALSLSYLYYK